MERLWYVVCTTPLSCAGLAAILDLAGVLVKLEKTSELALMEESPSRPDLVGLHLGRRLRSRMVSVARASRRRSGLRESTEEAATTTTAPV
ncbi:hypothetical protein Sros01_72440 [Streptomyces roseochromogenus]|nr:hypothetical protein Sros01_72440 [Streptomyces roseochromogenus]